MSYTQITTFVADDPINALSLNTEWQAIRDYINGNIIYSDFVTDGLETKNILRPDLIYANTLLANGSVSTWRWTSGLTHNFNTVYDTQNAVFFTNHTKNTDFNTRVEYQDMSDCGVKVVLENSNTRLLIKVYAHVVAGQNANQSTTADSDAWYLFVNDERKDETVCYTSYNGVGADPGGIPDKTNSSIGDRFVPVRFIYSANLLAGTYTFQVKGNPMNEYVVCRLRNFFVEIIN